MFLIVANISSISDLSNNQMSSELLEIRIKPKKIRQLKFTKKRQLKISKIAFCQIIVVNYMLMLKTGNSPAIILEMSN